MEETLKTEIFVLSFQKISLEETGVAIEVATKVEAVEIVVETEEKELLLVLLIKKKEEANYRSSKN